LVYEKKSFKTCKAALKIAQTSDGDHLYSDMTKIFGLFGQQQ
jgi:hypothetical protein